MMDYPCAKFGDLGLNSSGFSCVQTERETNGITDADDRYTDVTRLPSASVIN